LWIFAAVLTSGLTALCTSKASFLNKHCRGPAFRIHSFRGIGL
jgi:hypothetical protein